MTGRRFVDTNIFVYAADRSPEEQTKHDIAIALLAEQPSELVISTQVLQEFYVVVTRRLRTPMSEDAALAAVRGIAMLEVVQVDIPLVLAAMETCRTAQLSLWDTLVIEAARYSNCSLVLTEDLSHGQQIRGVTVHNPFRPTSAA